MSEATNRDTAPATIDKGADADMAEDQMRAIVQDVYGSADVLRVAQTDRPSISVDEVLVRVHAAGLDRGTWHLMAGLPYVIRLGYGFRGPKSPIPGLDVAGTVEAVGGDVTRFNVGDSVFGTANGSFAQFAAGKESKLAHMPANLTFEQAAVVPVSGMTALQGLRDEARLESGQHVLIIGASGGVGTYAVQLAKHFGAEVTGVCSTGKMDLVRSIGADHVIDYTKENFADGSQRYDAILDIGGNSPLKKLRSALTETGTLVIVGGEEGGRWIAGVDRQLRALALSPFIDQRLTTFMSKETDVDLEYLARIIDGDGLVPVIDRTYQLDEVPEAMRHLEAGLAKGKIVISLRPSE
jgi:NADPH:quinone reductase-like Zn-dependent oxidoreductase